MQTMATSIDTLLNSYIATGAGTIQLNAIDYGYTTTATAGATTTLTVASTYQQHFTGTLNQTVVLPVTSTLTTGHSYEIYNNSTGTITVNSSGGNLVISIPTNVSAALTCIGTTLTTAADWEAEYNGFGTQTGTGNVVLATSPTLTTPTIDTINASSATAGVSLYPTSTAATLSIGNLIGSTAATGTINIGNNAGIAGGTKAINLGTSATAGTTNITIGSTTGSTTNILGTAQVGGNAILTSTSTASALTSFGTNATLTTPTIDVINAASATGTSSSLYNNITTGTVAITPSATTGTVNVATGNTFAGNINIASGTIASGTKAINIGTGGAAGNTTNVIIGTSGGGTSNITLNGATTVAGGALTAAAGTTTLAPLIFQSGSLLTNAAGGRMEYDGRLHYLTPSSTAVGGRGVAGASHYYALSGALALTNVNTAQSIYGVGLTVQGTTTYELEMWFSVSTSGATSNSLGIGFGGTATLTSIGYQVSAAQNATSAVTLTAPVNAFVAVATNTAITAAVATATFRNVFVKGIVRVNASGTFIPQLTYSAAPGAAPSVAANSYIKMTPIGINTVTTVGAWA